MLTAVALALTFLICHFQHVLPIAMNLNPANGSVTAQFIGAVNAVSFECDIFHQISSGELLQILTTWRLQNFRRSGNNSIVVLQANFEQEFLISGTAIPSSPFNSTYRNRLTVLRFTEDLDRAVLICGTGNQKMGYFFLRVYRPPRLLTGLTREAVEGTSFSITLSDVPEEFPYPTEFQWTRNSIPITNSSSVMLGYPGAVFLKVSRRDSGLYSLSATNYHLDNPTVEIGRGIGTFQLNVLYGPDFIKGPSEVVSVQETDAVLLCGKELMSHPQATVAWTDNHRNRVDPVNMRLVLNTSPSSVSLTVRTVTESDTGDWTCSVMVENVGTVQHSILLTVVGSPSQPQNVAINSSGPTWIYLSWERPISPGFPISSAKMYVGVATRREDGSTRHTPPTPNLLANITDLLPNSVYDVSVVAQSVVRDVIASSSPSGLASIRTDTTVPEIECQAAPLSNNGMINVIWHYVHTGGLNLTHVSLLYSLNATPLQFQPLTLDQQPRVQASSLVLHQLPAGNSYVFKVTSLNDLGSSSTICPPVDHNIGIPQAPFLYKATSSRGQVTIEVATNESGTLPPNFFQFNVRALHAITLEKKKFTREARQYRDGEILVFVLTGFSVSVGGEPVSYNITASCTNMYGMSEDSNQLPVLVVFNGGKELELIVGAAGAAAALLVLVLCLVAIFYCFYCRKRIENKMRRYSPARHTTNSLQTTPLSITKSQPSTNGLSQHFSTSEDSLEKAISLSVCTSVPISHKDDQNTIYDSLAPPTASSLPPPSPGPRSTAALPKHPTNTFCNSTGDLGDHNTVTKTAVTFRRNIVQLQESKRKSNSVPDTLDQNSVDFHAEALEPISINRDLLELEEVYTHMVSTGTAGVAMGLRCNGHVNHVIGRGYIIDNSDSDIDDVDVCTDL